MQQPKALTEQNGAVCVYLRSVEDGVVDGQHCSNGEDLLATLVPGGGNSLMNTTHLRDSVEQTSSHFSDAMSILDSMGSTGNSAILRPSYSKQNKRSEFY